MSKTISVSLLFTVAVCAVAAHWQPFYGYAVGACAWAILLTREYVEE